MPRMGNKDVSGKKGSPPQDKSESGDMKIADLFRILCERMDSRLDKQEMIFKEMDRKLDVVAEDWRSIDRHVASLEHDARQPRLAIMVADGQANTKTR